MSATPPDPSKAKIFDLEVYRASKPNEALGQETDISLEVQGSVVPNPIAEPQAETPQLPAELKPYQLAIKAIAFYRNSGELIPGLHTEPVTTVRDQIHPPRLKSPEDLRPVATRDYYVKFFDLRSYVDPTTKEHVTPEDQYEIAQAIYKKTGPTSTVLSLMLHNPEKRDIPANAMGYSQKVLKEIMHLVQQGAIIL